MVIPTIPHSTIKVPLQDVLRKLGLWRTSECMPADRAKAMYILAYDFYQKAQYTEAKQIFLYLILGAEFDPKNLMGLAACFHAQKDFATALRFYRLCIQSGLNHPLIYFHVGNCLLHFGRKREAILELNKILDQHDGTAGCKELQIKARALIDLLEIGAEKKTVINRN